MRFPTFTPGVHDSIIGADDYFRYATIGLAVQRVLADNIPGAFAEAGVYRGDMTRFINSVAQDRPFFLFDTFEGFSQKDLPPGEADNRFRNTSVTDVLRAAGNTPNLIVKKGYVPETFAGLGSEWFSFVLLDLDLYKPTLAGLEFFYPRLSSGGFLVVHDYNSTESNGACRRAVDEFLKGKPEKPVELADVWGTILFRKV
jgi:O-methyltransferase